MPPPPLHIINAFVVASNPFSGNPAAVCLLNQPREESWLQSVAAQMNLSETAFLLPIERSSNWELRWFTPRAEVDLCGHATLASAHFLWQNRFVPAEHPAIFRTRSGQLSCNKSGDWIEMDFPAEPPIPGDDAPPQLLTALNASGQIVGKKRNRFDYLIELPHEEALRSLKPDLRALATLRIRGIIVTARSSDSKYDFVSRFFAPAVGVDEDPVTGSAHCCLAPYWSAKLGKSEMVAYQASPRGGIVRVTAKGDRVLLAGQAVTVLSGALCVN
jgi:predicted PhzF superfamily epimerase YddE/YHI9